MVLQVTQDNVLMDIIVPELTMLLLLQLSQGLAVVYLTMVAMELMSASLEISVQEVQMHQRHAMQEPTTQVEVLLAAVTACHVLKVTFVTILVCPHC